MVFRWLANLEGDGDDREKTFHSYSLEVGANFEGQPIQAGDEPVLGGEQVAQSPIGVGDTLAEGSPPAASVVPHVEQHGDAGRRPAARNIENVRRD